MQCLVIIDELPVFSDSNSRCVPNMFLLGRQYDLGRFCQDQAYDVSDYCGLGLDFRRDWVSRRCSEEPCHYLTLVSITYWQVCFTPVAHDNQVLICREHDHQNGYRYGHIGRFQCTGLPCLSLSHHPFYYYFSA
jgi:hypothetical protein